MGWDMPVLPLSPPLLVGVPAWGRTCGSPWEGHLGAGSALSKPALKLTHIVNDFNPSFCILFFQKGHKEI